MTKENASLRPQPLPKRPALNFYALGALVLALGLGGATLVQSYDARQEQRELVQWQNKLNLIADSREADIEKWLESYGKEFDAIATNPSVQLYLTALLTPDEAAPDTALAEDGEKPQAVFLRNMLITTAQRLGFLEGAPAELKEVHANVAKPSGTGLAIIGTDGKMLVATAGLGVLPDAIATVVAATPKGEARLLDIAPTADGSKQIGFLTPIYSIQAEAKPENQIATLIGVRKVGDDFYKLLHQPGLGEPTLEALLLRKDGENVSVLTPAFDKNRAGSATLALTTPELDAAEAVREPGTFAQKRDAAFRRTLMTSRAIKGAPWVLMLHIDRDSAMADSDTWIEQTRAIMGLALLATLFCLIAVWYYGTSRRNWLLSAEKTRLAKSLAAKEKLLRVVADHQQEPILLVDSSDIVRFANEPAARGFRLRPDEASGKGLVALMGPARGSEYSEANQKALKTNEALIRTWRETKDGIARVLQTAHIPLKALPIDSLPEATPGLLVIDQDVTALVTERENRIALSTQLVNTLVSLVDKRDRNAAHHSLGVALLAREIAQGMGLDARMAETAETAGKLMNIGKIVVPPELLTKTTPLEPDEKAFIRESLQRSADLIQNIPFDGPVVETLRQAQECYDGSGPMKIKGETILVSARVIAVANAFIGMTSPRAYRATMEASEAIGLLLQDKDTRYDQRVVVALAHFIENKRGKEVLAALAVEP